MSDKFDVKKHILVPEHTKLNQKDKTDILGQYGITFNQLPKILSSDPAIEHLHPKAGDVIKIVRLSKTAGKAVFYRGVVDE